MYGSSYSVRASTCADNLIKAFRLQKRAARVISRPRPHVFFFFPNSKNLIPRPHVTYSNRIRPSTRVRWYHYSLQYPRLLCTKMSSEDTPQRQLREICSVRPTRSFKLTTILVYCSVRDWTRFLRHRIRKYSDSLVHTLSDSLRISFFPLWRADLFFSGLAV